MVFNRMVIAPIVICVTYEFENDAQSSQERRHDNDFMLST